jgi:hypothetical protein
VVTVTVPFAKAGTYTVQVLGVTITGAPLSQSITITVLAEVMPHTGADIVPFSLGGVGLLIAGAPPAPDVRLPFSASGTQVSVVPPTRALSAH